MEGGLTGGCGVSREANNSSKKIIQKIAEKGRTGPSQIDPRSGGKKKKPPWWETGGTEN